MDSLYGGRPGSSFTIKKTFKSLEEMNAAFSSGDGYTDVWYDEFCIVDSENINNKENGTLCQRLRVPRQLTDGSAVYYDIIGRIAGPASGTPSIGFCELGEYNENLTAKDFLQYLPGGNSESENSTNTNYFYLVDSEENIVCDGMKTPSDMGENSALQLFTHNSDEDTAMPQYRWINVRKEDSEEAESYCLLEMDIPYVTPSFTAETISYNETIDVKSLESKSPLFSRWKIKVPAGLPGSKINSIEIERFGQSYIKNSNTGEWEKDSTDTKNIISRLESGKNYFQYGTESDYFNKKDDGRWYDHNEIPIPDDTQFIVFYVTEYFLDGNKPSERSRTYVIKEFTELNSISVEKYGDKEPGFALKFDASGLVDAQSIPVPVPCDFNFDINSGKITYKYTTDSTLIHNMGSLVAPIKIIVRADGKIEYTYSGELNEETYKALGLTQKKSSDNIPVPGTYVSENVYFKSIQDVKFNKDNGYLTMTIGAEQGDRQEVAYCVSRVKNIELDEDTGNIIVNYNGEKEESSKSSTIGNFNELPRKNSFKFKVDENNNITNLVYQKCYTGEEVVLAEDVNLFKGSNPITLPDFTDPTANKQILLSLQTGIFGSKPIQTIQEVKIYQGNVYALFSDPSSRPSEPEEGKTFNEQNPGFNEEDWKILSYYSSEEEDELSIPLYWKNIGKVSFSGLIFSEMVPIETITEETIIENNEVVRNYEDNINDIAEYLNKYYTDINLYEDRIIGIYSSDEENDRDIQLFYPISKNNGNITFINTWTYIGSLGAGSSNDLDLILESTNTIPGKERSEKWLFFVDTQKEKLPDFTLNLNWDLPINEVY